MASLKKVNRSPYWYIRRRDLDSDQWRDERTNFRRGDVIGDRAAQKLADKYSEKEAIARPDRFSEFVAWVPEYMRTHYKVKSTLARNEHAWKAIRDWMVLRNIRTPRQIRYEHAQDYLTWRSTTRGRHNTARLEIKFLSFLMNEALRREYCDRNPIEKAKIEKEFVARKVELSDVDLVKAREFFISRKSPEWMLDVFEILMNLGCRFSESSIPVPNINFDEKSILMVDSKRKDHDPRKSFVVPISDQFCEFLEKFRGQDRTVPILDGVMNQRFNETLRKACGATSHSFRVSFITRCHRAGLTEQECMRLVNHSQRAVHQIYSRLNLKDARAALDRVPLPPPPVSPQTPEPI